MEHSFAPIEDENSRVLILGSLPGVKSLEEQQYYAHPQNRFWKIMSEMLGEEPTQDYNARCAMMLRHGIALWDVVKCADREGSSDGNIKNQEPNDIPSLLAKRPAISFIIFNGGFAFRAYKKFFGEPRLPYARMLSTSPACAGRDAERQAMWEEALERTGCAVKSLSPR